MKHEHPNEGGAKQHHEIAGEGCATTTPALGSGEPSLPGGERAAGLKTAEAQDSPKSANMTSGRSKLAQGQRGLKRTTQNHWHDQIQPTGRHHPPHGWCCLRSHP